MNIKKFFIMSAFSLTLMSVPTLSALAAESSHNIIVQDNSEGSIMPMDYCSFTCNASNVNVRKGPGTSYASITKLQKGEWGTVIDYNTFDKQPTWAKVSFYRESEGKSYEGWVAIQYLNLNELRNIQR